MRKIIYVLFAVAFMLISSSAFTQVTQILIRAVDNNGKLLDGGSNVAGHLREIEAFSYSQGLSSCETCNLPSQSSFAFMMALNPATVTFKKLLLNKTLLTRVDVTYRRESDGFEYFKIHMENVLVESEQESGSSELPTVAISLIPAQLAWWHSTNAGKKTSYGWNFDTNTEWLYY